MTDKSDDLERILTTIKASNITTATIARNSNVAPRWLSDVIKGKNRNPGYIQMRKVEHYLDKHLQSMRKRFDDNCKR